MASWEFRYNSFFWNLTVIDEKYSSRVALPSEWNGDMIHQFKRDQLSFGMPLNGATSQENVVGVFAILKSNFIASFPDKIKPIRIREGISAFCLKRLSQLGTHRFQWTAPSDFRFAESRCRTNFTIRFRVCTPKSSLWHHHKQENHSTSYCRLG